MFFIPVIAYIAAVPVVGITNRVLREIVIPRRALKKAAEGATQHHNVVLDVTLSNEDIAELEARGAIDILARGVELQAHYRRAAQQR